ncbi:MAG TPA: flippase [Elainellaceae cyanobacterium]
MRRSLARLRALSAFRALHASDLGQSLAKGAGIALLAQILGVGIGYGTQLLLTRWMGASGYGAYDFAITLGNFTAFLAGFGLPKVLLRFIPVYIITQDWNRLRGIIWGSWWQTCINGLLLAAVGTVLVQRLDAQIGGSYTVLIIAGLWTVPLQALMNLHVEMSRGIERIGLAYMPWLVAWPLLLLLGAIAWRQSGQSLTGISAIALSMGALAIAIGIQLWQFRHHISTKLRSVAPTYDIRLWLMTALPLIFIDGSSVILNQTDILMLGTLSGTQSVGIYSAALKTASWVSLVLVAVNAIAAPNFAKLYAQGDRQTLQKVVSTVAYWIFIPAFILTLGLILFAVPILHWFGDEFEGARWSLITLAIGQLVNVGSGSVGYLMMMTGHQNQMAQVFAASAVVNLVLNAIAIPHIGILGASLATAFSMSLWNLWLYALVVKHVGVRPSIWAAVRHRT